MRTTYEREVEVSKQIGGLRLMRGTILALVAAVVLIAAVNAWAHWRVGEAIGEANRARTEFCTGMHTLNVTLDRMIADGRGSLDAYLADGTITRVQYDRELQRIAGQREALGGADCPPR